MINTGNFGTKTKANNTKVGYKKLHGRRYSRDAKIWNDYKGVCEGVSNGSVGS